MAEAVIGGVTYRVALPNFKAIKKAWPFINAVTTATDPMASTDAILDIVATCGAPAATRDALEEALTPAEMGALPRFLSTLMAEIRPGEAQPAGEAASPSTATSTDSSSPSPGQPEAPTGT